jgi:hypothetical protein
LLFQADGVVEATDTQSRLFGFEPLQELLKQGATASDVAAEKFRQQDDISVISVGRMAAGKPFGAQSGARLTALREQLTLPVPLLYSS